MPESRAGRFTFPRTPLLHFGVDAAECLAANAAACGRSLLWVHGRRSLEENGARARIAAALDRTGLKVREYVVSGEPSPHCIDEGVTLGRAGAVDLVAATGGGAVLDAGKAIAAMLPVSGRVREYLEGVGHKNHPGHTLPFLAVPTTAGTGSEATVNAVISEVGPRGFKKSLRHPAFMPQQAIIDPSLAFSCSPGLSAACGMDALAQLLESFISAQASPLSDALVRSALPGLGEALVCVCGEGQNDLQAARSTLAYAAFVSGLTLTAAGLGTVHGMAGPLGGYVPLPHGVLCAALLPLVMDQTARSLTARGRSHAALVKMEEACCLLQGRSPQDTTANERDLPGYLATLAARLPLRRPRQWGLQVSDVRGALPLCGNKHNPVALSMEKMELVLNEAFC